MKLSTRDAFWLAVLCLVLAAWGWDRGRLSKRLDVVTENFGSDLDGVDPLVQSGTFDQDLPIELPGVEENPK